MPPAGQSTVAGAVTGAVIGAAIGSPRDTGEGAVAGAIVGAIAGASSDAARRKENEQRDKRVTAAQEAERARLERQASDYRRAISACLEGRGYTVK
jgi:outer membrane lipoprotein SlyB